MLITSNSLTEWTVKMQNWSLGSFSRPDDSAGTSREVLRTNSHRRLFLLKHFLPRRVFDKSVTMETETRWQGRLSGADTNKREETWARWEEKNDMRREWEETWKKRAGNEVEWRSVPLGLHERLQDLKHAEQVPPRLDSCCGEMVSATSDCSRSFSLAIMCFTRQCAASSILIFS